MRLPPPEVGTSPSCVAATRGSRPDRALTSSASGLPVSPDRRLPSSAWHVWPRWAGGRPPRRSTSRARWRRLVLDWRLLRRARGGAASAACLRDRPESRTTSIPRTSTSSTCSSAATGDGCPTWPSACDVDPSTITRTMHRMEAAGLADPPTRCGRRARRDRPPHGRRAAPARRRRPTAHRADRRRVRRLQPRGAGAARRSDRTLPRRPGGRGARPRARRRRLPGSVRRRGRPLDLRRPGDAVRAPAVLGRPPHDPQPGRRRGPRPGDLPARVPRVRRLHRGHQPAGLAVPDPDQRLHQHATARASAGRRRPISPTSRTCTSTSGCRRSTRSRPAVRPRTSCSIC